MKLKFIFISRQPWARFPPFFSRPVILGPSLPFSQAANRSAKVSAPIQDKSLLIEEAYKTASSSTSVLWRGSATAMIGLHANRRMASARNRAPTEHHPGGNPRRQFL